MNDKKKKPIPDREGYTGYLYIRCEKCGKEFGFNSKQTRYSFHCRECDWYTRLIDLLPVRTECKCGKKSNYKTNITDPVFTIDCFICGSPIDVERVRDRYKTII